MGEDAKLAALRGEVRAAINRWKVEQFGPGSWGVVNEETGQWDGESYNAYTGAACDAYGRSEEDILAALARSEAADAASARDEGGVRP